MAYTRAAIERAMKVHEVILQPVASRFIGSERSCEESAAHVALQSSWLGGEKKAPTVTRP